MLKTTTTKQQQQINIILIFSEATVKCTFFIFKIILSDSRWQGSSLTPGKGTETVISHMGTSNSILTNHTYISFTSYAE